MTIEQFKLKLKLYLLEKMETDYSLNDIDEDILLDLLHEYLNEQDDILKQIYVNVDTTNLDFILGAGEYDHDNGGEYIGIHRLNNMGFCGMLVGGEYEIPIFLIIFFNEDGELKVYIPEKGNLYNKITMETYESEINFDNSMLFNWDHIKKDIEGRVVKKDKIHMIEVVKPTKKQDISQMSTPALRIMLDEAVEAEEYMRAAEVKKEIDRREI